MQNLAQITYGKAGAELDNRERVAEALDILNAGLRPFVRRELQAAYGKEWVARAGLLDRNAPAGDSGKEPNLDTHALLAVMWDQWNAVFNKTLGQAERAFVSELRLTRNKWAHQEAFTTDDAYRALDSAERLLSAVAAQVEVAAMKRRKREVFSVLCAEQTTEGTKFGTTMGLAEAAKLLQALGICKAFGPTGRINGPNCQRFGHQDSSTKRWCWDVAELLVVGRKKGSADEETLARLASEHHVPWPPAQSNQTAQSADAQPNGILVPPARSREPAQATAGDCARTWTDAAVIQRLGTSMCAIVALLNSPRRPFSSLREWEVPDRAGLYVIYLDHESVYAGRATDLRFRIMKNHLAYQGDDNFVRYLKNEAGLATSSDVRKHIKAHCSVQWVEIDDPKRLSIVEHLLIAAVQPRLNRG